MIALVTKCIFFLGLTFGLSIVQAAELYGAQAQRGFVVTRVVGSVVVRKPLDTRWIPVVENYYIEDNSLLQVTRASSVDLFRAELDSVTQDVKRLDGENNGVSIGAPAIVRIGSSLLRKIELSRYFMEDLPKMANRFDSSKDKWYIDEAWRRIAAIMTSTKAQTQQSLEDIGKVSNGTTATGVLGQISVLTPGVGAYFTRNQFPSEIKVAWLPNRGNKSSEEQRAYKIFLWRRDEDRGDPVAIANSESYQVKVPSPGDYLLQIEAIDGSSRSSPRRIFLADELLTNASNSGAGSTNSYNAKLMSPKLNQQFITSSSETYVRFSWVIFDAPNQDLAIVIKKDKETIVRENLGDRLSYSFALAPGSYTWYLGWKPRATDVKDAIAYQAASDIYAFTIKPGQSQPIVKSVKSALDGNESTVLIIDQW